MRGVLIYSENRVIVVEMLVEREFGGILWRSVVIGWFYSLVKIWFLKFFVIRKFMIERFDDDVFLFYSVYKNIENGNKYVLLDVLLWSIVEYFNKLSCILMSFEGELKYKFFWVYFI